MKSVKERKEKSSFRSGQLMKNKIIFITLMMQLLFSQDSDSINDFLDYPIEKIQSPIVYEPEKKPNWNSDLERFEYI